MTENFSDNLRVTLAQIDIEWENPDENRRKLETIIPTLKGESDLILLPETFTTGFTMNLNRLAESMSGPTFVLLQQLSSLTGAAIGGSLIIRENGRFYNRFVFVKPDGSIVFYNKRHLFSIGGEDKYFHGGVEKVIITYKGWRIAPFICYDLRFPVWSRSHNEVDFMIYSANWPDTRIDVWNTLLKARAIENQVYVAGVNRIGTDGNQISYNGNSQLIDPRGMSLVHEPTGMEKVVTETFSLSALYEFRRKFPVVLDADAFELL